MRDEKRRSNVSSSCHSLTRVSSLLRMSPPSLFLSLSFPPSSVSPLSAINKFSNMLESMKNEPDHK